MSGQEIYDNFASAPGTADLMQSAEDINTIQKQYSHRAEEIRSLSAAMEEGWTGDGAGAATRGAGPLMTEHTQAASAASQAQQAISAQADAWHSVKSAVQPVPPAPSAPSSMPALLQDIVNADIESQTRHSNNVAAANVQAMGVWSTVSDQTGRALPTSYGQIDADAMNISAAPTPATHGPTAHTGSSGSPVQTGRDQRSIPSPDHRETGGYSPSTGTSAPPPARGASPAPQPSASGDDQSTSQSSYVPPGEQTGIDHRPPGGTPGMYRPGILDPNAPSGNGNPWSSGGLGVGGGFVGGTAGNGGAGAFGAGGSSEESEGGRAPKGEPGPGGGRGSGAGVSEGTAARGGAPSSAAGRPGSPGVGGVGAGGSKKGAEEDEEHERKYVLSDDEAFLAAEDGQRLIDPQTGMAASPAVIGESPKKRA